MNQEKELSRPYLPVAVPGLIFIFASGIITGLLFYFEWAVPGLIALFLTCFVCWFFRDPERFIPKQEGAIVSPADGKVIIIERVTKGEYVDTEALKISIFMNVFNVHVNRVPFDGVVQEVKYTPGKFFNASFDKASEFNERSALTIKTKAGYTFKVVQIAGLIARRIVCKIEENTFLRRGDRYGMIRFGSRLDLYLPCDTKVVVSKGQKVNAGSSILGYFKEKEV
ncbi:MAG: phosphatidylserine decarboxylase family protein [Desulfobacteraceae bacterium]|nr:phosphatidylserine decarboxylase family protein [Desulfobacteraceae bacterium]